ncbi:MAG: MinD/ParA family protein [Defluviitaleaceae bacterium]|nr:MinD/ParA family protein [Defluviitaleaceae bacterium]MCL2238661.1 MinD/ParA family protein [Defluviitaleaceae bacterium]
MTDQAKTLRDLVLQRRQEEAPRPTMSARVYAVASGKGGVGKSNFVTNLAVCMRKMGKRVVIIDADFGLANIEILLGIHPKHTVADVLHGTASIEMALTKGPLDIMFLSGGTGMLNLHEMSDKQLAQLTAGFIKLDDLADCIIIDTRAGLSNAVVNFIKAADETVIITTPDPTAIADAYALIKSIRNTAPHITELKLIVNCADSDAEAEEVQEKLSGVCERFLGIKLVPLGTIPYDTYLARAVRKQKPVTMAYPSSDSAKRINDISNDLLQVMAEKKNSIYSFVLKLIGRFNN